MDGYAGIALRIIIIGIVTLVAADLLGFIDAQLDIRVASLIASIALLVYLGPSALSRHQGETGAMLRHVMVWLFLALVFALAFILLAPVLDGYGFFSR